MNKDLKNQLCNFYGEDDGLKIYVVALLKLLDKGHLEDLEDNYQSSFLSKVYPKLTLSTAAITTLIKALGQHDYSNKQFLVNRIENQNRVLIFNNLANKNNFFKEVCNVIGRTPEKADLPDNLAVKVLDPDSKEAIYFDVKSGNDIEKNALLDLLSLFNKKESIVIVDKGFNTRENLNTLLDKKINFIVPYNVSSVLITNLLDKDRLVNVFKDGDNLVYGGKFTGSDSISPLKNDDSKVEAPEEFDSLDFLELFTQANEYEEDFDEIQLSKASIAMNLYSQANILHDHEISSHKLNVYLFRDSNISLQEQKNYFYKITDQKPGFTDEKFDKNKNRFGAFALVTNLNDSVENIYNLYKLRWDNETNPAFEKSPLEKKIIRNLSLFGTLGINFINNIETIMINKLSIKLEELNLLQTYSPANIISLGKGILRILVGKKWLTVCTTAKRKDLFTKLGLKLEEKIRGKETSIR